MDPSPPSPDLLPPGPAAPDTPESPPPAGERRAPGPPPGPVIPPATEPYELTRGALWEDVIHGAFHASLLGALLFPSIGTVMHLAGQASIQAQAKGFAVSFVVGLVALAAKTRVASRVVVKPDERVVYDAVKIGRTVYLQKGVAFDQAEAVTLVRRERRRVLPDQGCEAETPTEGRGELRFAKGGMAITNWVDEDPGGPQWSKLRRDLKKTAATLGVEFEQAAQVAPPVWEVGRSLTWILSIGLTAGVLVVLAG